MGATCQDVEYEIRLPNAAYLGCHMATTKRCAASADRRETQGRVENSMKSNRLVLGLLVSLIVAGSAFYAYDRWQANVQADAKTKAQHDADQQRIREEIASLGAKHNAVSDWRVGLFSGSVSSVYSVTLQNALVRSDGRPTLFFGSLHDVTNAGDSLECVFDNHGKVRIRFVLACSEEQSSYVMKQHPGPFRDFFAIVAQIEAVAKLDAESTDQGEEDKDKFRANGRCIALLSVANYRDVRELFGLSDYTRTEH